VVNVKKAYVHKKLINLINENDWKLNSWELKFMRDFLSRAQEADVVMDKAEKAWYEGLNVDIKNLCGFLVTKKQHDCFLNLFEEYFQKEFAKLLKRKEL